MSVEKFVCCLCGKTIEGWGNNPWPVSKGENDRCCGECNCTLVIPARLARMEMAQLEGEKDE